MVLDLAGEPVFATYNPYVFETTLTLIELCVIFFRKNLL